MPDVWGELKGKLRGLARTEAREVSEPVSRWKVIGQSPLRISNDAGETLEDGDADFEPGSIADAIVGDTVLVAVDTDGDYVGVGVVVSTGGLSELAVLKAAVASGWVTGDTKTSALLGTQPGWLRQDGQALPAGVPATAALRAKLIAEGSVHGSVSGDPKVPNMNDKIAIGGGPTATRAVGATGGVENVTLTDAQSGRPAATTGGQSTDHTHSASQDLLYNIPGGGAVLYASGGASLVHGGINTNGVSVDHTHPVPAAGGAASSHTNMPPTVALTHLIKL